jgi:AcrR family transcriptional regulator
MPKPRRPYHHGNLRRALLDEALATIRDEGVNGLTLREIGARVGVSRTALYRHFADKRALYLALLERHRADLGSFAGAIQAEGPLEARLRAVLEVWLDYVQAHSYAWRMLFRDTGGGEEVRAFRVEVHAEARTVLAGMIRHLAAPAAIPERELEPLAELLSMGMASLVLWWIETPGVEREAVLDAIARVWTGLLTPRAGGGAAPPGAGGDGAA